MDNSDFPAFRGDAPVGVARLQRYLPELESLRGVAMLMVLSFHLDGLVRYMMLPRAGTLVSRFEALIRSGENGVSLFFVLSAFLLAVPFLAEGAGGKRVEVRGFFQRRLLRILPLYYCGVTIGIVATTTSWADLAPKLQYFLVPNGIRMVTPPMPPFSDVWWSLHTEAQFYLLLPLLPLALKTRRGRVVGGVVLAVWASVYAMYELRVFRPVGIPADLAVAHSIFGRAPLFLWGILASAFYRVRGQALRDRLAALPWMRNGGADALFAGVILALLSIFQWRILVFPNLTRVPPYHSYHAVEGGLWALVILMVLIAPLRVKPLFHNRLLEHLGVLSYSMYMVHMPVFHFGLMYLRRHGYRDMMGWNPKTAAVASVLVVAAYAISRLTYRYIETPFLQRKARV